MALKFGPGGRQISEDEHTSMVVRAMEERIAQRKRYVVRTKGEAVGPVRDPKSLIGPRRRVRVIRNMGLGDVLLITPLIRALSVQLAVDVDVFTERKYVPLFDNNPYVASVNALEDWNEEAVVSTELTMRPCDSIIDLREYAELPEHDEIHRAECFLAVAGFTPGDSNGVGLDYFISDTERSEFASILDSERSPLHDRGTVALVWKSTTQNRNWSPSRNLSVIEALNRARYRVIVLDSKPQGAVIPGDGVIDLTGKLELNEVAGLIAASDCVITPDTGLFHLAQAIGTPTVAYFGAFPATERATREDKLHLLPVISDACTMLPCRSYQCPYMVAVDGEMESPCIAMEPDFVVEAVRKAIAAKQ